MNLSKWLQLSKAHKVSPTAAPVHIFIPSLSLHLACGPTQPHHPCNCIFSILLPFTSLITNSVSPFKYSNRGIWLIIDYSMGWLVLGHVSIPCMSKIWHRHHGLCHFERNAGLSPFFLPMDRQFPWPVLASRPGTIYQPDRTSTNGLLSTRPAVLPIYPGFLIMIIHTFIQ